jgi:magnesium and cobalt transporter
MGSVILPLVVTSGTNVSEPSPAKPPRLPAGPASRASDRRPGDRRSDRPLDNRSLLTRLVEFISPGPDSREELIDAVAEAEDREVIGPESRAMLEGVIRMSDMTAGDVMVAAPRMDMLDIGQSAEALLHEVIDSGHSRFPAFDGERDNIIGILLAKDLLKLQRAPELHLRALLRPAVFVPESKGLNELLRDFRSSRNHMAIVIDEFGATAGLITIEDILEEIVGEIEDEFDERDAEAGVVTLADGSHRVAGDAELAIVNSVFGVNLPLDQFDTIGGLVADTLGHVPRRGEAVTLARLKFTVMLARGGAVRWFRVVRAPEDASTNAPEMPGEAGA